MKRIFRLMTAALAVAAFAFASCSKDSTPEQPQGPEVPEPPLNEVTLDGAATEIKSVFVDDQIMSNMVFVGISTAPGLDSYTKMTEMEGEGYKHKFILIGLASKGVADSNLDVMTTAEVFSFVNMSEFVPELQSVAPGFVDGLSAGTLRVKTTGGKMTLDIDFTLTDAKNLKIHLVTDYQLPEVPTKDILALDGEVRSVKSAFYEVRPKGSAVYLTPSPVLSASSLEDVATYFVSIYADASLANGFPNPVDITKTTASFEFRLCIPVQEYDIRIATGDLKGATGTFSLAAKGEGKYEVELDITVDGRRITGNYASDFTRYTLSTYTVDDSDPIELKSAVMVSEGGKTTVYLSAQAGLTTEAQIAQADPIVLELDTANIGMGMLGFSSYADASITYKGTRYSQASDAAGNVAVEYEQGNPAIWAKFQLYSFNGEPSLKGQYVGNCTVVNK